MAASPYYKVHTTARGYIASLKFIEDAAAFVAIMGDGTKILTRWGTLMWHEGHEAQSAAESYDYVAEVAAERNQGIVNPQA